MTGNKKKINGVWHIEVMCPHCKNTRYVRKTLLSNTNKDKLLSTLCISCNNKTVRLFKQNEEGVWYTVVNGKSVYVDEDDIPRIKNLNLQLMYGSEMYQYVGIRINKNKAIPLHRFLMGVTDKNKVVDHINHNTLDDRKFNLRVALIRENAINSKISTNNNIGFKNISLCNRENQKWFVQYRYNGGRITKRFSYFLDAYRYLRESETYKNDFLYDVLQDENTHFRYSGIDKDEVVNGEYIGATIYTQFCSHHCKNCHNPSTWSKEGGREFNKEVLDDIMKYFSLIPYAKRLTISGGDPMDNIGLTNVIASEFKYLFPDKKLWIYTGYTYEYLKEKIEYKAVLELCDYLVDGEYMDEFRDITLAYRGSSNQRIIDMEATRNNMGEIVLWKDIS